MGFNNPAIVDEDFEASAVIILNLSEGLKVTDPLEITDIPAGSLSVHTSSLSIIENTWSQGSAQLQASATQNGVLGDTLETPEMNHSEMCAISTVET